VHSKIVARVTTSTMKNGVINFAAKVLATTGDALRR